MNNFDQVHIDSFHRYKLNISQQEKRERRNNWYRFSQYVRYRQGLEYENLNPPLSDREISIFKEKYHERDVLAEQRQKRKNQEYLNSLKLEFGEIVYPWEEVPTGPPRKTKWMRFKTGNQGYLFKIRSI